MLKLSSNSLFDALVELAPEGILVLDAASQHFIYANPSAETMLGCAREELLNNDIAQFFGAQGAGAPQLPIDWRDAIERALAGFVVNMEHVFRLVEGRHLICDMSLVRLPVPERKLLRVSIVDVTQREQRETDVNELNLRLQSLFNAAQEVAIISTDVNGRITVFNHGAELMLGYTAQEMLGQSPERLHLTSEVLVRAGELTAQLGRPIDGFETFVALTREGGSDIHNWTYVRKDHQRLRVSLAVSAVRDKHGHIFGFLGVARDITAQTAAQNDLLKLNRELDSRVQERTRSLQTSSEQLQAALDRLQRAQHQLIQSEKLAALGYVVTAVAHELNTPIGNCLTVATTLEERTVEFEGHLAAGGLRRSDLDRYVQHTRAAMELLQDGLNRAANLVTRFKQVAVRQSDAQRQVFDLKEVVDTVWTRMEPTLRSTAYQVETYIPSGLSMQGCPSWIETILSNLVDNSITHGFEGRVRGLIQLHAVADGTDLVLTYSDDGRGMSEEARSRVFDPFYTTTFGKGGSGLGMSICYNLVTGALGGSIQVTSIQGQGCSYTLRFPRMAP